MKTFSPEEVVKSFRCIVPALNPLEQLTLMEGFKSAAPPAFFEAVMNMLASTMPKREGTRLIKMLDNVQSLQTT